MNKISKTQEEFRNKMHDSVTSLGYTVDHIDFVSDGVIKLWLYAKDGIPVTGQFPFIVLCANHELTMGTHRHRPNHYFWQEGLAKLATPNFWLCRGGARVRGALTTYELLNSRKYDETHYEDREAYRKSHRAEAAAYKSAYDALHRDDKAAYNAAYYKDHRAEVTARHAAYDADHRAEKAAYTAKRDHKLWTNGTDTLKWYTLKNRARKLGLHKPDLIAQGWHPIE